MGCNGTYKKDPTFLQNWLYLRPLELLIFFRTIMQLKKCYCIAPKTKLCCRCEVYLYFGIEKIKSVINLSIIKCHLSY